jgi:transmembrane sensor
VNVTLEKVRPDTSRGVHPALDAMRNRLSRQPTLSDFDTTASIVTTITAGEQLVVDSRDHDHVRRADPDRVTSWQRGELIFDNTPLVEAIAELNRYSDTKIMLATPALANLRISGVFATGRPRVFVQALSSYFPVAVASSGDQAIVLKAR